MPRYTEKFLIVYRNFFPESGYNMTHDDYCYDTEILVKILDNGDPLVHAGYELFTRKKKLWKLIN